MRIALSLLLALGLAGQAGATDRDLRSISGMRGHHAVILAFAPTLGDARLEAQRAAFARIGLEAAGRDLLLVQVDDARVIGATDKAPALRRRFHIAPDAFQVMVIGKDGSPALSSATPVEAGRLVAAIDATPARQAEVRDARAGRVTAER
jgi:hypothetical protein